MMKHMFRMNKLSTKILTVGDRLAAARDNALNLFGRP